MKSRFAAVLLGLCSTIGALAGCSSSLPSTELPPARFVTHPPAFPGLSDYRGIMDCRLRPTGIDQAVVAKIAQDAQIDFISLGDRADSEESSYGLSGFTRRVLFIPGASFKAGASGAEIMGLNLTTPIDPAQPPSELIAAIKDQAGLAVAVRPERFASTEDYALADAVEVYSQAAVWQTRSPFGLYLRALFFGSDRFFAGLDERPDAALAAYDRMAAGGPVALVAGMGRAQDFEVMGSKVGTYRQLFRVYVTHLLAPERQAVPLLDALRRGRAYVSFDLLGYVGKFSFYARDGENGTLMGGQTSLSPQLVLTTVLPGPAERIVLLRNGVEVASTREASELTYSPTEPGAYRIEAYRRGLPWILSNPVYLR